jgi:hypothetical protein
MGNKTIINSNQRVLNIIAFEAGVPKSFSIIVAQPIAPANNINNTAVNRVEKRMFFMD